MGSLNLTPLILMWLKKGYAELVYPWICLNPLKYKASVKMDGALKQGVIASIEYVLQIRLVCQKCLTIINNHLYIECRDAPF